jgi:Mlc titration factor MtfA (ptsG expression regulator)
MIPLIILIAIGIFAFYFFKSSNNAYPMMDEKGIGDFSLLKKNVLFYSKLTVADQKIFEEDVLFFLQHTRITGVDTTVEELDKWLIASAAVVPIFYFKDWKYNNLREVLLYSDAINIDFESTGTANRNILGMVGTGALQGSLLLSKKALHQGFDNTTDKHNTAIHEFVHLIDKADGDTDGMPDLLLDKQYVLPWINMIHEQMLEIAKGKSDIDPYAYTNKAEFFAVAAEYFFERPDLLQVKHPQLFDLLQHVFIKNQHKGK